MGLSVWIDEEEIKPSAIFQEAIEEATSNTKSAAIIIGESGLGRWQKLELNMLISNFVNANLPVIPVLLPKVYSIPNDLKILSQFNHVKFDNNIDEEEPINRLIWGITNDKTYLKKHLPTKSLYVQKRISDIMVNWLKTNHQLDIFNFVKNKECDFKGLITRCAFKYPQFEKKLLKNIYSMQDPTLMMLNMQIIIRMMMNDI